MIFSFRLIDLLEYLPHIHWPGLCYIPGTLTNVKWHLFKLSVTWIACIYSSSLRFPHRTAYNRLPFMFSHNLCEEKLYFDIYRVRIISGLLAKRLGILDLISAKKLDDNQTIAKNLEYTCGCTMSASKLKLDLLTSATFDSTTLCEITTLRRQAPIPHHVSRRETWVEYRIRYFRHCMLSIKFKINVYPYYFSYKSYDNLKAFHWYCLFLRAYLFHTMSWFERYSSRTLHVTLCMNNWIHYSDFMFIT